MAWLMLLRRINDDLGPGAALTAEEPSGLVGPVKIL